MMGKSLHLCVVHAEGLSGDRTTPFLRSSLLLMFKWWFFRGLNLSQA